MPAKRTAYPREYKKFGLRYAHTPQEGYDIAGVVQVADHRGKGYAYIKFLPAFVDAVGKAMPFGVSPDSPCYVKILYSDSAKIWKVYTFYIGSPRGVLLWEAVDRPEWLRRIRRHDNGKSKKATRATE